MYDNPGPMVVGSRSNETLRKSIRNLEKAKFLPVEALNVFDILHHDQLILSEEIGPSLLLALILVCLGLVLINRPRVA